MKMKKTDIGVVAFMYLVCAYFYSQTVSLPKGSQTYPSFTIALLFGLTTLYLIRMILAARMYGVESGRDLFKGFKPLQFIVCFSAVVLYLILIYFIGFYPATVLFMAGVLLFLKVPVVRAAIAMAVILLLIYFAFGRFLGVRLPEGELFRMMK